jgi:hypothetical protein
MNQAKILSKVGELSIWVLLGLVFYVWADQLAWDFGDINRLNLFPLFGMVAYVTMWWHFLVGYLRRTHPEYQKIQSLHQASFYLVFASIILHPALLVWYAQDLGYKMTNAISGSGLTPVDFYADFYPGLEKFILLGYLGLIGFLTYDLGRVLKNLSFIKKSRQFIMSMSDIAFGLILVHSLNLGRHLQTGWFRVFWLGLGLSGLFFILHRYYHRMRREKTTQTTN